jgi:uncharacterized membrane protein
MYFIWCDMSKERLEAFSDWIFAAALTLLVVEIYAPNVASHSSLGEYAAAMAPLIPKVFSFTRTFVLICIHWVSHHHFFRHLRHTPLGIVWLNNLFLLWLCLMPFSTAMLGNNPTDQFPILLYAVNQLLAALTFFAFRSYAVKNKLFEDTALTKAMGSRHSIPSIIIFTLSILFVFVNVYLSLACFILVPFLYFVPNMMQKHIK